MVLQTAKMLNCACNFTHRTLCRRGGIFKIAFDSYTNGKSNNFLAACWKDVHTTVSTLHIQPKCNNNHNVNKEMSWTLRRYSSGVSEDEQVYYGTLTPRIYTIKFFSLSTSSMGFFAQPFLIQKSEELAAFPLVVATGGFVIFITYVTPFLLHYITKKYVTTLHYNPKTNLYTATVLSFFMMKKKVTFSADDVVVPDAPGMFTSFLVKGVPLFVDPRNFENPMHYGKIMGYDKPLDFKLGTDSITPDPTVKNSEESEKKSI